MMTITPSKVKYIAAALGLALLLFAVYAIRQGYLASAFEKRSAELEKAKGEAEKRAAQAEGRATENARQAQAKESELIEANAKAEVADRALGQARNITVSLKQGYDQIRNRPIDPQQPVSVSEACAKLETLGYQCN